MTTTQPNLFCLTFCAALMLLVASAGCCADELPDAPREAVLHLTGGDFVPGELRSSSDPKFLRWQSPLFTQPLEFSIDGGVSTVHYPPPPVLPKPTGEYCFELAAGDVLFGDLLGLTDEHAELDVPRFGRLHVRRDHIRRLYRSRGDDLIYIGPSGLAGWSKFSPGAAWREDVGMPSTDQPDVFLFGDFKIPAQATIEFEVSWKKKPDFLFALDVDERPATVQRAFRFEVWDSDLVVHRETENEADVVSVQEVKPGPGRAHLITYLDRQRGRLLVFSPAGTQLADLDIAPRKSQESTGLWLANKRGDVRLDRLRISRWNGVAPLEVQGNKSRLHRNDGSIVYGQLAAFDSAGKTFTVRDGQETTRVAADQIASVFLSPAESSSDKPAPAFRAVYQDGTQLSGEPTRIDDDQISLTHSGIREPLRLPIAELRSLVVLERRNSSPGLASDGRMGILEMNGVRLRGQLMNGDEKPDASCLVWRPEQSRTASPLRPGAAGRIVYREPPPPPKPVAQPQVQQRAGIIEGIARVFTSGQRPAAATTATGTRSLHLRSGDMIPCEVTSIDESGLTFKTPLSDATFVEHGKIKAVELTTIQSPLKLTKSKRERLLTLPRVQKDSPPTQLICSTSGDFLRGRLLDMDDKKLRMEVRLETKELERRLVSQIIWFHPDELADSQPSGNPPTPTAASSIRPAATRVQALRSDGVRLTFVAEQFAEQKILSGKSDVLGACRADVSQVDQLLIGDAIEKAAAELAYHKWKLHNATLPKFAQDADGESPADRIPGTESPLVGKPAPDFTLDLLGGDKFHLADSKGKIVVLDFWATWCGPCLQAMPQVERVVAEFNEHVQLIAVNLEESGDQITSTLDRHKLTVAAALDRDGVVAAKYAVTAIPQTVIIDRAGNVARLFVGGGPHIGDQLREAIQSLISGGSQ